ncbi:MAG: transketolase family protein [Treponema sp.]|nr:transketolase family protein [Treponema sp.]
MKALREAFGDEIMELGKKYPNMYVIDADISKSCKTVEFQKAFPKQHINVGIAEQNAAGIAAGLATVGIIPIVSTYAVFGSLRMCEQIRQEMCYPNLNAKIMCSHGGFTPANDGASHQAIEDMGVMRSLPNMTVIAPADYYSARTLIRKAVEMYGPVYMRFTRDAFPFIYESGVELSIGKANLLREGRDAAIIASGDVMEFCLKAADALKAEGINARLLDMHTIKPLDTAAVIAAIDDCGVIVTVEDHSIINGLGSAVAEVIAEYGKGKLARMGARDQFGESGPYAELLAKNGVSAEFIVREVKSLVNK